MYEEFHGHLFRKFRTCCPDEQLLSIAVVDTKNDDVFEFEGTLGEFCKKFKRKYDNFMVDDPLTKIRDGKTLIVIDLLRVRKRRHKESQ